MRLPTELFEDHETLNVGGVEIELNYHGVNHSVGNSFIYLPKQKVLAAIDIFSPGWTAFRHCDASENIRGWTEAHDWILEYDFNAVVCGHTNHWGTRADAQESRDYVFDMVEFSKEALNSTVDQELFERFGLANAWVLWDAYFNELSNEVTYKTLNKVTDNGQTWAQRLAGADVMTKYHAYSILEALRLESRRSQKGLPPDLTRPQAPAVTAGACGRSASSPVGQRSAAARARAAATIILTAAVSRPTRQTTPPTDGGTSCTGTDTRP
jgi:hypothetical protein